MNTSSMYFNKFSSGTILALLALSGMLFLVPLAAPVHAGTPNASLPTLTSTPTAFITGAAGVATSLKVTNPITISYAITSITIFAPTGFTFGGAPTIGTYLNTDPVTTGTAITFGTSGTGLAPGFTDTLGLGTVSTSTASPVTSPPPTGTFTTTLIDAGSNPASYPGPSWVVYDVAATTSVSVTYPAGSSPYTAGSAAITITVNDGSGQAGVPVTFKSTGTPFAGFTAVLAPTSGVTGSAGTVTTSFQPSNHATDSTTITGTIGGGAGALTGASAAIVTQAAAPSKVTFYLPSSPTVFPTTDYVTTDVPCGTSFCANIIGGGMTYAATDAFGNPAGGAVTGGTLTAANGYFAGNPLTTTCTVTTGAGLCQYNTVTNVGAVQQYSQSGTYATIGQISAVLQCGATCSVSGTTGFIQTSTFANSATFPYPVGGIVAAGSKVDVKLQLGVVQSGVPVKLQVCVHTSCAGATSAGYVGTFSDGLSSITGVTNSSGSFGSAFAISTALGATVVFNATITQPQNPVNTQSFNTGSSLNVVTTGPGAAAKFQLYATFFDSQLTGQTGFSTQFATAGGTLYVDAILTDAYGNIVANALSQQIQVSMALSGVSGGGLLSATQIYLASGCSSTNQTGIGGGCLVA